MSNKRSIAKKAVILCVLNVIRRYASREAPVSQIGLTLVLNKAGIPCDRKTVGRNIAYLREFGYPIEKIHGKGYYLDEDAMAELDNPLVI